MLGQGWGELLEKFSVSCGFEQRCVRIALLSIIFMDKIIKICELSGLTVGAKRISHLLFADDLVLLVENP